MSRLVVSLLAGRLVGRSGEVRLIRALHVAVFVAFVLVASAPGWGWVFAGTILMGVPLGLGNPATNALIAQRLDAAVQGTATGI